MPKCYILQEPMRLGPEGMVPMMDFRKVLEYGDPVFCLPSGKVSLTPGPTIDLLKEKLKDFSSDDYVVSVGDPSAIFIAAMVIGSINNNSCKLLKWDRNSKKYIEVKIDLNYHRKRG